MIGAHSHFLRVQRLARSLPHLGVNVGRVGTWFVHAARDCYVRRLKRIRSAASVHIVHAHLTSASASSQRNVRSLESGRIVVAIVTDAGVQRVVRCVATTGLGGHCWRLLERSMASGFVHLVDNGVDGFAFGCDRQLRLMVFVVMMLLQILLMMNQIERRLVQGCLVVVVIVVRILQHLIVGYFSGRSSWRRTLLIIIRRPVADCDENATISGQRSVVAQRRRLRSGHRIRSGQRGDREPSR